MIFFQKLINQFRVLRKNQKGVALLIVLSAMATLAIFVGEVTYTAQINQKLAYDRLDQVKAQALAKSGLKIALLRIRAYSEIKKTIGAMAKSAGASADAVNSVVPKSVIEKIWSEPITVPFSGDISALPSSARDGFEKFRKDSSMEGKLYISIQAQSDKFNLNSILPQFAAQAASSSPTPKPGGNQGPATPTAPGAEGSASPTPAASPVAYDPAQAKQMLLDQVKTTFQKKFDKDEKFRDNYRSYRIEDLVEDIFGWSDLSYDSPREQSATIPFKKAPFYNLSELHYLQSMDDDVYDLLADQFTTGVGSSINVNTIKEPVLRALVPTMTDDEVKKFFEFRDSTGESANTQTAAQQGSGDDNSFKTAADFFSYIKNKVQFFGGSDQKITEFQTALAQRGIEITTDESNFLVHVEATVGQTKRTLEAMVSMSDNGSATPTTTGTGTTPSPTPPPVTNPGSSNTTTDDSTTQKSNLKITQLRFL
jgi:hypothetical protein